MLTCKAKFVYIFRFQEIWMAMLLFRDVKLFFSLKDANEELTCSLKNAFPTFHFMFPGLDIDLKE